MKVVDVHPEELLDRELRGTLNPAQRVLLDSHLAHCESCRLERLLRADFAADAARADQADMQAFVLGALQRAGSVQLPAATTAGRSARRRLPAGLLVACILLVAAGAAAARTAWVERIVRSTFGSASEDAAAIERKQKRMPRVRPAAVLAARDVAPLAAQRPAVVAAPAVAVVTPPERGPAPVPAAREKRRGQPSALRRGRGAPALPAQPAAETRAASLRPERVAATPAAALEPVETPMASPESAPKLVPPPSAAGLFEQANRARRGGDVEHAAALYEQLQNGFAASAEARLSYALLARMWLDAGNAYAAFDNFDDYLASGDRKLREEAMAGRALALERLGRKRAAETAFAELLRAFPHSSYAPLAKKRLGQD